MKPEEPISFYVPARNAEQHLAECIAAVRAQTRPPDELFIIVDPRSQDRTVEVARSLAVPVLEQTGATLGAARNQAIQVARHRWLASCDSDVFIQPDWLERLSARRSESAAGIGGRTFENIRTPYDDWRSIQMPHHWGEHPLSNPFMLVSEVIFDRQALLAMGGYRDDLNYYEDSDLCQRLRDAGCDLAYEPSAIAFHQRSDTLTSILDLRWKYSEYRQRHLLDRYGDLLRKLPINREYALNTLSRLLARGREDLTFISFFLYFHHLLLDLRSLQSRRPLLTPAQHANAESQLLDVALESIKRCSSTLAARVQQALGLSATSKITDTVSGGIPNWQSFLENERTAAEAFCAELTAPVLKIVKGSAEYLMQTPAKSHANKSEPQAPSRDPNQAYLIDAVPRLSRPSLDELQSSLDTLPIQPAPLAEVLQAIQDTWPDSTRAEIIGRATDDELAIVRRKTAESTGANSTGHPVAIVLRLEIQPEPFKAITEIRDRFSRLVICYQPPTRFIPGLDVASASDLASNAVTAGWTIDRFDTLIGRTRLMLSRH